MDKKLVLSGKILLALLIIGAMVYKANISSDAVRQLDWRLLALAGCCILLQNVICAVRWQFLLRALAIKISFYDALSLTMQGIFWMIFLPGGTLGGDLVKIGLTAKAQGADQQIKVAFSVIMDRICGFCGLALLSWFTALIFLNSTYKENSNIYWLLVGTVYLAPLIPLAAAMLLMGGRIIEKVKFLQRLTAWFDGVSRGSVSKLLNAADIYCAAWKNCLLWVLISGFIAFPLFTAALIVIGKALTGNVSEVLLQASLLCGSIGEFSGIVPLTPAGIGVRDAVFALICSACGCSESATYQIPLIFTSLTVIAGLTGGVFALTALIRKSR